jgi:hypothetical protein
MGTLDYISLAGVLRSSSKDLPVANPVLWYANERDNAFEYHWADREERRDPKVGSFASGCRCGVGWERIGSLSVLFGMNDEGGRVCDFAYQNL